MWGLLLSRTGRRAAGALAAVLVVLAAVLWLRYDAAQQREQELRQETYQDRILRMQEDKERRDAAQALDDDSLLDALGRWLLPAE